MRLSDRARRWLAARPALAGALRPWLGPVVRRLRGAAPPPGRTPDRALQRLRARLGLGVTRDEVLWCYRHLLGREPESEAVLQSHLGERDFESLVRQFAQSPEHLATLAGPQPQPRPQGAAAPDLDIGRDEFRRVIDAYRAAQPPTGELDEYIATHFERLLHTLNVVHRRLPVGGQLIDFCAAAFFSDAVQRLHPDVRQTSITGVNFERDDYVARFGEDRYDLCLNTEVLEHLAFDPAHMVFAINRMLKPGGLLFLTTPNAVSLASAVRLLLGQSPGLWSQMKPGAPYFERHNREWTPDEVCALLREHGFDVVEVCARDFYASTQELLTRHEALGRQLAAAAKHPHLGDTLCVLARKQVTVEAPTRAAWLYA